MLALCAESTSELRIGIAWRLIATSRRSLVGYCTASAAVTLPALTVICTWTGPKRVCTVEPLITLEVAAGAAPALAAGEPDGGGEPEGDVVPVGDAPPEPPPAEPATIALAATSPLPVDVR